MKYTARHIQRFLETGEIDATLWKNHFPSLLPTQVPLCGDCAEFKDQTCDGGREPVACLLSKARGGSSAEKQKQKKRDPLLGLGARVPEPRGTARPRDQSKM